MSAPPWYMPSAAALPLSTELKPEKSGGSVRYLTSMTMFVDRLGAGLVARLELLDQVGVDAADEADVVDLDLSRRRADEVGARSSAKVIWSTFGPAESGDASSTMANLTVGLALAAAPTDLA